MCGIAGTVGEEWSADQFAAMCRAIRDRGPDGHGVACVGPIRLGMNRLRLRGPDAQLPIQTARYMGAINGQVYGVHSAEGYRALPTGVEHELESIRDCAAEVDGMYACALAASDGSSLWLGTDRWFIKPMFYRSAGRGIAFCSELAPLLSLTERSAIDREALAELFLLGWYVDDRTCCSDISSLCRSDVRWTAGGLECKAPKLRSRFAPMELGSDDDLGRAVAESTRRCLEGSGPWGLAVSGGLDSSILAWLLDQAGVEDVVTLSVHSPGDHEGVESLEQLGLPPRGAWRTWKHQVVEVGDDSDFLRLFDESVARFGQPTTMSSLPMVWRLAEVAAEAGVRVLLTGEGVDELFAGYSSYTKVHGAGSLLRYYRHPPRERLAEALFGRAAVDRVLARFCARYDGVEDLRCIELEMRLARLLLRTDVCLMSHSIEARVPFLHNHIPERALAAPWQTLVLSGGKLPLRRAFRGALGPRADTPKVRFKTSDQRLRRLLADDDLSSRIRGACGGVFGDDAVRIALDIVGTDEGFDADIACLLMSLAFVLERGRLAA